MPLTRREFLLRSACVLASTSVPRVIAQSRFAATPFTLGIASGYPHAGGVTLWTRLAPEPLAGGGMPAAPVEVAWVVAEDERFSKIAARGRATASPQWGHSVHVDVKGLEPAHTYWYRFRAGGIESPLGRTRTAPAVDSAAARLRLAFAACQQYEQGYFGAYRQMAGEDLDLVVHLGDYIYESSWGRDHVRKHASEEPYTLEEYRNRYAQYKADDNLQAAHAVFPWVVTWDDHEVDNDYANDQSQDLDPPEAFLARRAAAYQAYYEHMPLPAWARPRGRDMQLYTSFGYGALASFFVLDTRQYRSHHVCRRPNRGGTSVVRDEECAARRDPALTVLGARQERWLHDGLARTRARWNLIAQQTLVAQSDRRPGPGASYWTGSWDGYPRARERLLASVSAAQASNPLVLSGDIHMSAVADLKADFDDPRSPVVATEFVCPSITSHGPGVKRVELILQENPHIKFANGARRGYTTLDLTRERCTARIRTIASAADPDSAIRTFATYTVQNGRAGAERG